MEHPTVRTATPSICVQQPRYVSGGVSSCIGRVVPGSAADRLFRSYERAGYRVIRRGNEFFADDGQGIRFISTLAALPMGYEDAVAV